MYDTRCRRQRKNLASSSLRPTLQKSDSLFPTIVTYHEQQHRHIEAIMTTEDSAVNTAFEPHISSVASTPTTTGLVVQQCDQEPITSRDEIPSASNPSTIPNEDQTMIIDAEDCSLPQSTGAEPKPNSSESCRTSPSPLPLSSPSKSLPNTNLTKIALFQSLQELPFPMDLPSILLPVLQDMPFSIDYLSKLQQWLLAVNCPVEVIRAMVCVALIKTRNQFLLNEIMVAFGVSSQQIKEASIK